MKPKKKNKFFTFLCSFLPGAAEMYMGFMKMGISLLAVFFASFALPALIHASDVFICLTFVIWIFGFFHARNLATTDEQEFEKIQDQFIWEKYTEGKSVNFSGKKERKVIAWILILIGATILWHNFKDLMYRLIPDVLWETCYPVVSNIPGTIVAVLIIYIGIKLIAGKKQALGLEEKEAEVFEESKVEEEKDGK